MLETTHLLMTLYRHIIGFTEHFTPVTIVYMYMYVVLTSSASISCTVNHTILQYTHTLPTQLTHNLHHIAGLQKNLKCLSVIMI